MPKPKRSKTEQSVAPFEFVLDELASLAPTTRPLFGCLAIYVGEKIVLALRRKEAETADNGVWVATTREYHASLRRELPSLRSIQLFGTEDSGWQIVPEDSPDFTVDVHHACELIRRGDLRIGKAPKEKARSKR